MKTLVVLALLSATAAAAPIATRFNLDDPNDETVSRIGYILHENGEVLNGRVDVSFNGEYQWFERPVGRWNGTNDFLVSGFWRWDRCVPPLGPVVMTPGIVLLERNEVQCEGTGDSAFRINVDVTHIGDYLPGDANMDGRFNSADLWYVFRRGSYEDNDRRSWWHSGDFTGDYNFNSADLVAAMQTGRYENDSMPAAVPEPGGLTLLMLGLLTGLAMKAAAPLRRPR